MSNNKWNAVLWDKLALGVDCFELFEPSLEQLEFATKHKGHYTARVNPLASKADLNQYGFYYCDTLIEPYVDKQAFRSFHHPLVTINQNPDKESIFSIAENAFVHGRFHRDFNIAHSLSEKRYDNWLQELLRERLVYGLYFEGAIVGFIGVKNNALVLHAVDSRFRGRGLAKYLWSPVCQKLFDQGFSEITSSISAANLAVLNLYASLGFRFRNSSDIYHRFTP